MNSCLIISSSVHFHFVLFFHLILTLLLALTILAVVSHWTDHYHLIIEYYRTKTAIPLHYGYAHMEIDCPHGSLDSKYSYSFHIFLYLSHILSYIHLYTLICTNILNCIYNSKYDYTYACMYELICFWLWLFFSLYGFIDRVHDLKTHMSISGRRLKAARLSRHLARQWRQGATMQEFYDCATAVMGVPPVISWVIIPMNYRCKVN